MLPAAVCCAVFLGDPQVPDDHAGVLELDYFDGDVPAGAPPSPPRAGFFLLSFFVDVPAMLAGSPLSVSAGRHGASSSRHRAGR